MREILRDIPCYLDMGESYVITEHRPGLLTRPRLPILCDAWVAHSLVPEVKVLVKVLLDTGNDVTIIEPQVVHTLENEVKERIASGEVKVSLPIPFPIEKFIPHCGREQNEKDFHQPRPEDIYQPVCALTFFLTATDNYSSELGPIVMNNWDFEGVEVWLGQDILSQLIVTFNGVDGTISISDPNKV